MAGFEWTLIDTETTGLHAPIYVVELAAQRMREWEPVGSAFHTFINHNVEIPEGAQGVHGYSREFLARKGARPHSAHLLFNQYAGRTPIVSYNLPYDCDKVLIPEWERIGHKPHQTRGFCAMRLAQKLIDPSSVANFKLQTLRRHFEYPDHGAHSLPATFGP